MEGVGLRLGGYSFRKGDLLICHRVCGIGGRSFGGGGLGGRLWKDVFWAIWGPDQDAQPIGFTKIDDISQILLILRTFL